MTTLKHLFGFIKFYFLLAKMVQVVGINITQGNNDLKISRKTFQLKPEKYFLLVLRGNYIYVGLELVIKFEENVWTLCQLIHVSRLVRGCEIKI